jgi:hypothetical protein
MELNFKIKKQLNVFLDKINLFKKPIYNINEIENQKILFIKFAKFAKNYQSSKKSRNCI